MIHQMRLSVVVVALGTFANLGGGETPCFVVFFDGCPPRLGYGPTGDFAGKRALRVLSA